MLCWRRGREVALARREADAMPLQTFIDGLSGPHPPLRVQGTAIYFTTRQDIVPAALSLNLKHNGVVHENLMFLKITTARVPEVAIQTHSEKPGIASLLRSCARKLWYSVRRSKQAGSRMSSQRPQNWLRAPGIATII
jgi:K+ transporter